MEIEAGVKMIILDLLVEGCWRVWYVDGRGWWGFACRGKRGVRRRMGDGKGRSNFCIKLLILSNNTQAYLTSDAKVLKIHTLRNSYYRKINLNMKSFDCWIKSEMGRLLKINGQWPLLNRANNIHRPGHINILHYRFLFTWVLVMAAHLLFLFLKDLATASVGVEDVLGCAVFDANSFSRI